MSTEYNRFKAPISSVRWEERGGHVKVTVFVNGANAGELTLRGDELSPFIEAITERDHFLTIVYKDGKPTILYANELIGPNTPDSVWLVSEYNQTAQLGEIRALAK